MDILLGISPIIIILIFVFLFKKPLFFITPIIFIYTLFLSYFFWEIENTYIYISLIKAFFISLDILIIIFGAILFLEFLKIIGFINFIKNKISLISEDIRIQVILIVWFFGSFIEGIAGFGMPAVITGPILFSLGFSPILAVSVALIGNSTAVIFGAVGTPIRIGFASLELENIDIGNIVFNSGLINLFAGVIVPLLIVFVVVFSRKDFKNKDIIEIIPFSIISGFSFTVPYFLISFLNEDIPSILGPILGLFIILYFLKKKIFIPSNIIKFSHKKEFLEEKLINKKGIFSCIIFLLFLFLGKIYLPSFNLNLFEKEFHNINLFNPGFAFLLSIFISILIFKISYKNIKDSIKYSLKALIFPSISIFFIVGFTQIMIYSGNNFSGKESMIESFLAIINPSILIFISPLIGAFGAFISGSATVSNILFSNFQLILSEKGGFYLPLILSLQLVGAGIGNMLALTNIISAQSTVGIHNKEKDVIKNNFIPFLIYLFLVIMIGLIINLI